MASIPQLFNQAAASAQSHLPATGIPTPAQTPSAGGAALPVPQQPIAGANAQQQAQQQTLLPGTTPAPGQPATRVDQSLILQYARALAQSLVRAVPGLGKLFGQNANPSASTPTASAKLDAFGDRLLGVADKLETLLSPGKMAYRGESNLGEADRMREEAERRLALARQLREQSKTETDPHVLSQMLREARKQEREGSDLQDKAGRKSTIGSLQTGFGQVGQGITNAGSGKEASAAGDVLGGAGKLAAAIPLIGKPIAAMLKFGEVVLKSLDRLQEWTNSLHESNMRFAEFSSSMAAVQARQMQRDIQLSRERGENRAETAEDLAQAKARLDRQLSVIQDYLGNIYNSIASDVVGLLSDILSYLPGFNKQVPPNNADSALGRQMALLGSAIYRQKYGRPPRFSDRDR